MTDDQGKKRLRLAYSKGGWVRFISHLDLLRLFHRAVSRAGIPVLYSSGFSPHPRISFAPPLKVGMAGDNELLDIRLTDPVDPEKAARELNRALPDGISVVKATSIPVDAPSLGKVIREAEYLVFLPDGYPLDQQQISAFLSAPDVPVRIEKKGKLREFNSRQGVYELRLSGTELLMRLSVKTNARPYAVLAGLTGAEFSEIGNLRWRRIRFRGPGL